MPAWAVAEMLAAEALSAVPFDAAALERSEAEAGQDREASARPAEAAPPLGVVNRGPRSREASPNGCASEGPGTDLGPSARGSQMRDAAGSPNGCASWDPLLASLLEGLDEADPFELDSRLRRALEAEQRLTARMGQWLLAVARGGLYRGYGCSRLGEFAREWLGISPSKADALVRLERVCRIAPTLREAYRAGRLSWAQAQLLVPLLRREDCARWQAAWVAHAERVSVRRLGDEVSQALALGRLEPPPLDPPRGRWPDGRDGWEAAENGATQEAAADSGGLGADSQTGAHPRYFPQTMAFFFTAPPDVARLFRGALATVQRAIERRNHRTASESEALDAILEHAFETWGLANATLQRAHRVFERDAWRCRGKAPGGLRFDLGLRPGRPPLARYRSGDVLVSWAPEGTTLP